MRKEEIASWDGGKSTWGGRVRVFGTVPVCVRIQERAGEPEMPLKKKAQISLDKKLAFKIQAKEDEQERTVREKAQQIEEVNLAWDDIQAKVDADYELAERLQAEEQEQLTDSEKVKLFMEFMEKRITYE
nr:hypothetical protein [Tanacetum cinerariifolium]